MLFHLAVGSRPKYPIKNMKLSLIYMLLLPMDAIPFDPPTGIHLETQSRFLYTPLLRSGYWKITPKNIPEQLVMR